ncbi:hypothetical protein BGW80DRAFT_1249832 [Lactifluus volemus]|nr:hypothetical protein BGW80DRAFT_1249832 [Lactifluus volemus]
MHTISALYMLPVRSDPNATLRYGFKASYCVGISRLAFWVWVRPAAVLWMNMIWVLGSEGVFGAMSTCGFVPKSKHKAEEHQGSKKNLREVKQTEPTVASAIQATGSEHKPHTSHTQPIMIDCADEDKERHYNGHHGNQAECAPELVPTRQRRRWRRKRRGGRGEAAEAVKEEASSPLGQGGQHTNGGYSIGIDHDAPLPTMTVKLLGQVEGKMKSHIGDVAETIDNGVVAAWGMRCRCCSDGSKNGMSEGSRG